MAMKMGDTTSSMSDINVTPMIDVLLVLLVIFIIIQPLLLKSIDVQLPVDNQNQAANPPPRIVLEISATGEYALNTEPVPVEQLEARLTEVYRDRPDKVLFIKADGDVIYQEVIAAMDAARGAGVEVLGTVIPEEVGAQSPLE